MIPGGRDAVWAALAAAVRLVMAVVLAAVLLPLAGPLLLAVPARRRGGHGPRQPPAR